LEKPHVAVQLAVVDTSIADEQGCGFPARRGNYWHNVGLESGVKRPRRFP